MRLRWERRDLGCIFLTFKSQSKQAIYDSFTAQFPKDAEGLIPNDEDLINLARTSLKAFRHEAGSFQLLSQPWFWGGSRMFQEGPSWDERHTNWSVFKRTPSLTLNPLSLITA